MKTIAVCQRKGGNGKSTSVMNLAQGFAERDKKVVIIDLDDQKNTTSTLLRGKAEKTVTELLLNPGIRLSEVANATEIKDVSLVAASGNLSGVIRELDGGIGNHAVLKEKLSGVTEYDICLIDTAPSLSILTVNALTGAEYLFIPLTSSYFSLQGLGQTVETYEKVRERLNKELVILGMAFVLHDGRSNLSREIVGKVREEYGELVCQTVIGKNIKIEEAQAAGASILGYAPLDRGADLYRALTQELLQRMGKKESGVLHG